MKNSENVRFQLEINAEPVCIAGVDGFGVLTAIVDWVKRDPARFDPLKLPHSSPEEFSREKLRVQFSGLDSNDPQQSHHLSWHERLLKIGDVVSVRILGPGPVDEPGR